MAGILVYALHYEGAFNKNSLGAVSEGARLASELGTECHAIVVGEGISDDLAGQASTLGDGAERVLVEGALVVERVDQDPAHASSFLSSSHATIFSTVSFVSSSSMIWPADLAGGALKSEQRARALS